MRFSILRICWIPNGELISCSGASVEPPGSISIARETSLYISPNSSKGPSILFPFESNDSSKDFLAIKKILLKELEEWKLGGKYESRLLHEAQEGNSLGMGEALGWNLKCLNIKHIPKQGIMTYYSWNQIHQSQELGKFAETLQERDSWSACRYVTCREHLDPGMFPYSCWCHFFCLVGRGFPAQSFLFWRRLLQGFTSPLLGTPLLGYLIVKANLLERRLLWIFIFPLLQEFRKGFYLRLGRYYLPLMTISLAFFQLPSQIHCHDCFPQVEPLNWLSSLSLLFSPWPVEGTSA